MRILVAYGSRMGGTRGPAETLGSALTDLGHDVELCPAATPLVTEVHRYREPADS